jgi:4-amino-4-deoxy-L-arabinose transferase-like glycosyltransferase
MMAVFGIGGWEIVLILAVFAMMIAVPLIVLLIVLLVNRQGNKARLASQPPPIQPQQS